MIYVILAISIISLAISAVHVTWYLLAGVHSDGTDIMKRFRQVQMDLELEITRKTRAMEDVRVKLDVLEDRVAGEIKRLDGRLSAVGRKTTKAEKQRQRAIIEEQIEALNNNETNSILSVPGVVG